MSSQPPIQANANVQRIALDPVELKGIPSRLTVLMWLGTTALIIISSVVSLGAWYISKSFEANESKLTNVVRDAVSPLKENETKLRIVVGMLVNGNTAFTPSEKDYLSGILKQISYEGFKSVLEKLPEQSKREPLDQLIASHRVEQVGSITGLVWGDGYPAQIRYIRSKDASLNLKGVDFYTTDDDPCESRNLDSLGNSSITAKVCTPHLKSKSRLELIVLVP